MMNYDAQLSAKTEHLKELLAPFYLGGLSVFASQESHYRSRAEFGVWHEGEQWHFTMMLPDSCGVKTRTRVDQFEAADRRINEAMQRLSLVLRSDLLRRKLFQVEFLSTTTGELLITMIYHKALDEEWIAAARPLEAQLGAKLIGRSRKQKLVLSEDFVTEEFCVQGRKYCYVQPEGAFTQPNARVCAHMLNWASSQASQVAAREGSSEGLACSRDFLELYCGIGNFTLPLSSHFRSALATEVSKTSTKAALENAATNQIEHLTLVRLSAEEVGEALAGTREFRRLKQAGVSLQDYDFACCFVDPPRAGVDEKTLHMIARFDHLIYVSCNPETLVRDLKILQSTHEVVTAALFDQFPYTHHMEAGVRLIKRR